MEDNNCWFLLFRMARHVRKFLRSVQGLQVVGPQDNELYRLAGDTLRKTG